MNHNEFKIDASFWFSFKEWRCTDIGQRTVVAIHIEPGRDPSWYSGPPYAVLESVFDEYDIEGCCATEAEMT
ncbi:hypothetical protein AD932_13115 [Gluconobacter oxydans]|nr:hypothetical protein AD932_13115 [Gluconobacter oxydans]